MQNLGEFLKEYSLKHQDRVAFEIKRGLRTQRFTFADVYSLARKTATFLSQKGLKKGDKVAIWAPNMPEYAILYFGCWILGVVAVPIDVRTTQETLKIFLTKAKCKLGFKSKFVLGQYDRLVYHTVYLEDLVDLVKDLPNIPNLPNIKPDDLAEIAFTSGTTGTPKGVMLTHGNYLSDVESLTKAFPFKKEYRALSLLPLSHAFEQVVDFLVAFKSGIKVAYLERTNRLTILKAMKKGHITSVALVPQALKLLMTGIEQKVEEQGKQKVWKLLNILSTSLPIWARGLLFHQVLQKFGGSLKFFGSGSAPLNPKLAKKWENLGIEVFEGYGASETTAVLTINTPKAKKIGSVGKVLPGMEVRINPDTHEIEAKGPNISPGYFEDEEKTKAAFYGGWYKTGDVGELDKDGFLYITGRVAFRIVLPNGQKVYPEDLEKKLNTHPLVVESCIVGVKREEGEVVHAAIITKSPEKLDTIIREVNEILASHEQILEWSLWKGEDFPRTPILKIDRRKVAEMVEGKYSGQKKIEIKTGDLLTSLISKITKIQAVKVKESSTLGTDLKMDSLGRVELLSVVEQEFAVAVSETAVNAQTTVGLLRKMIKTSPATAEEIPINETNYSPFLYKLRLILQNILIFPLHALFVPMKVSGKENLEELKKPTIFYFNHIGIMDGLCVLRVLPDNIRRKLVIAVVADLWKDYRKNWVEVLGAGFPFDKKEKIKASLELTGEFLDKGFSLLIAPEGELEKDGKTLQFKPGAGFLAVEMQVPVVPIKIDPSYREIFPPMEGKFVENIPKKRKRIWIKIGKPIEFKKGTDYDQATKKMQEALEAL